MAGIENDVIKVWNAIIVISFNYVLHFVLASKVAGLVTIIADSDEWINVPLHSSCDIKLSMVACTLNRFKKHS